MSVEQWEKAHNKLIDEINDIMDNFGHVPSKIAEAEYMYTKLERIAWRITGHYKSQFKLLEARAEQMQARGYERIRKGDAEGYEKFKTVQDAQYMSRLTKGLQLEKAAEYEGLYDQWRGFAKSYENSVNAIKDILKAIVKEGG